MKSSLRTQLFSQNMLFSTLLLFFIGGYLAIFLFQQDIRTTHTLVQNQNKAINLFIEGYFNEIKHNVDFLAADINVQNGDIKGKGYRKKALHIYKQLQNSNSNIYFVFSGYQGKGLLINNYTAPKGYMMEKRPWYKAAVNSFPHLSIGEPYQDITFKDWLVATSKALSRNGKIYGVVSIDCSTDNIISALQRGAGPTQEFESFVINKKGQIIIHPNSNLIGKKIGDIFSENLLLNKEQGYIETAHKNLALFYSTLKSNGWVIITTAPLNELEAPIVKNIVTCLSIVALFCLLWGYAQSLTLSKRIVEPLATLRRQVQNIIGGQISEKYTYPKNDIGQLAHEVESIVTGKIYAAHAEVVKVNQELTLANKALEREQHHLEELACTDLLTGMYNRYKIDKCLDEEWRRSKRYATVFSVIIIDIDKFKNVNDTYGHQAGDLVLKDFSKIIRENIRQCDSAGRWGGEEFIILLPETPLQEAYTVANKLRIIVENFNFSTGCSITMSAGLGTFDHNSQLDNLLKTIDKRLYIAKQNGRNMVVDKG